MAEQQVASGQANVADFCCCRGLVGNTAWKCLGRGLDLGHCRAGDCPQDCLKTPGRPPLNDAAVPLQKGSSNG